MQKSIINKRGREEINKEERKKKGVKEMIFEVKDVTNKVDSARIRPGSLPIDDQTKGGFLFEKMSKTNSAKEWRKERKERERERRRRRKGNIFSFMKRKQEGRRKKES